jgi:hypothetical protein
MHGYGHFSPTGRFVPETTLVASLAVFVETYRFKLDIYRPFGRHY